MYETNLDAAEELCKRVQENLKNSDDFIFNGEKIGLVTMSFGVSCTTPKRDDNSEHLIKLADDALYIAKGSGRNCIVTN
jgi:diguanylate cyclase (GGDEF)-like protein